MNTENTGNQSNNKSAIVMLNDLRNKLKAGDATIGAWQMTGDVNTTCVMASLGFDWIVVDLEHSMIDLGRVESIFIAAERYDVVPLVRLPNMDPYLARRLLDSGAQGILIPVVEEAENLSEFIEHCLYPPKGKRGLGLIRPNLWGDELEKYYAEFKPLIIPQIETLKGYENLGEILDEDAVDGIFIGPYDLSANIGLPGQLEHPKMKKILSGIKKITSEKNKFVGIHQVEPDKESLNNKIEDGYNFVAFSTDTVAIRYALQGILE